MDGAGRDAGRPPESVPPVPTPEQLRVSDRERHAVAEVLREAAGEGRITLEELEERLEAAYAAKTYADLVPITSDLPVRSLPVELPRPVPPIRPVPQSGPASRPTYVRSIAVLSESSRAGVWQPGPEHQAFALLGSVVIDLREAWLPAELVITANAVLGSVEVIVNAGTRVALEGVGVLGSFNEARPKVAAEIVTDSPTVRVNGVALLGSVEVQRKGPPKPPKRPR